MGHKPKLVGEILDMPTPFELEEFQNLLQRDSFTSKQSLDAADAILYMGGVELSLTPKE